MMKNTTHDMPKKERAAHKNERSVERRRSIEPTVSDQHMQLMILRLRIYSEINKLRKEERRFDSISKLKRTNEYDDEPTKRR